MPDVKEPGKTFYQKVGLTMGIKVGINGFGRIGRVALRIMAERPEEFEICGINIRNTDLDFMVYQLKYDTVFGRFNGTVDKYEDGLVINGRKVRVFGESDAVNIPWSECGAEYIIESTGVYLTAELAGAHLNGGAKKVIMSAPAKDDTPMFVVGVNHDKYTADMKIVSNASCTTNCLAPMVKVLNDTFGVEQGLMSTIHSSTSKQHAVDARDKKDWRIGRSVYGNIIPSTTGAAKAVGKVIPELNGKLTGMSFRIPAADASIVDLTVRLKKPAKYDEIGKYVGDEVGAFFIISQDFEALESDGNPAVVPELVNTVNADRVVEGKFTFNKTDDIDQFFVVENGEVRVFIPEYAWEVAKNDDYRVPPGTYNAVVKISVEADE